MKYLYNTLVYYPLLNALVFFYNTIALHDLGLAIIFLTLLIRVILYPLFARMTRHQLVMQGLQPRLQKIREEHKDSQEKQAHATMALFRENKVNPFSGLFLMIVQLPILIALYQIFVHVFDADAFTGLYSFVARPGALNTNFLGLINLQERSIVLVSLAAVLQFVQTKMSLPKQNGAPGAGDAAAKMGSQMAYIGPVIILLVFANLPAALSVYLIVTTVFSIFQHIFIHRQLERESAHEKLAGIRN